MGKTAWLFPGQGSQQVGMGVDLAQSPLAQERFAQAEALLGWSVLDCCRGELGDLGHTLYTQPCLYTVEAILVEDWKQSRTLADYVAGHSLGEYVALYAAGVFDFETGLDLVRRRSQLMDQAANGTMVALIGFDRDALVTQVAALEDVVLANDNHPDQVVISGTPAAVDQLLGDIKVKRAVPLNVSGAFHSPLMATAAAEFNQVLDTVVFSEATIPVLSNVEPSPTTDPLLLKQRLQAQMTGSVRWRETCLALAELGVTTGYEIGPGNVLAGLMKRTTKAIAMEGVQHLGPS
ncbi:ACP S-malonyltransferase [Candidatus Synechococcus calcipolaris G9]|uniref:Malonyl CoA-acyl carrier protein transacylase n=1 Tax=Candidatus Synechococcus calcipolaris G9 TaxID=1497997 RepID=A0ABT6EYW0_9SYNE|nr:ACP S-malonyltransferase [Candidatus Synechococcus calcipolaris]MDG2990576.1 ACP S-malonyltransferase [Candidatus Synechococcus calcipolaris G9]